MMTPVFEDQTYEAEFLNNAAEVADFKECALASGKGDAAVMSTGFATCPVTGQDF